MYAHTITRTTTIEHNVLYVLYKTFKNILCFERLLLCWIQNVGPPNATDFF